MCAALVYCCNLKKGDEVWLTASKRAGVVAMQPRESASSVSILIDGIKTRRYIHISFLRLMVDGQVVEDVPPCDGEPPAPNIPARRPATEAPEGDPHECDMLREQLLGIIERYQKITVYQIIGCLEAIKLDLFEAAANSRK